MATAEAASDPLGPQYAPKDPTLPKPWEGLVDGSTGLLYYWNPETNVTQYEKPAAPAPPLPSEPPPPASTPKLAPIPMARNLQSNVTTHLQPQQHPGQQMPQQHPGQQMPQQHPGQQMQQHPGQQMAFAQTQQMTFAQTQQMPSQQGHQYPPMHMQQMPYPQMSYQQGPRMPYQPQQQLQGPQIPYQPLQQQAPNLVHQESQVAHSVQQPVHPQGQQPRATQSPQQQTQYPHGPQGANQPGQQIGFPRGEELGRQEGKQTGFSLPLVQQSGAISSSHHLQGAAPQANISQIGVHSVQPEDQHSVPSSVSTQQTGPSSIQLQQAGIDASYRQRQMGSPVVNSHMGNTMFRPPMGPKMGYEGYPRERIGDEFHSSSRNEGPMMIPHQPKFGALPPRRDQQDMRMSSINPELKAPGLSGGLNMVPGNRPPNMHNNATISNGAPMRQSPRVFDPSDYSHTSATDAYCQHHEVSALGDNVPAPFMTFEATGFPPEILKERAAII